MPQIGATWPPSGSNCPLLLASAPASPGRSAESPRFGVVSLLQPWSVAASATRHSSDTAPFRRGLLLCCLGVAPRMLPVYQWERIARQNSPGSAATQSIEPKRRCSPGVTRISSRAGSFLPPSIEPLVLSASAT